MIAIRLCSPLYSLHTDWWVNYPIPLLIIIRRTLIFCCEHSPNLEYDARRKSLQHVYTLHSLKFESKHKDSQICSNLDTIKIRWTYELMRYIYSHFGVYECSPLCFYYRANPLTRLYGRISHEISVPVCISNFSTYHTPLLPQQNNHRHF